MAAATALKLKIEHALEGRFPAALSPAARTIRDVAATGIEEADRLLEGGFPVGAISEITGPASSGRTSMAMAFVAQRIEEEHVCAWVDAHDAFDPESAAANGILLRQLLWIRCRDQGAHPPTAPFKDSSSGKSKQPWTRLDQAIRTTDLLLQSGGFASIVLDLGETAPEHGCRIPLATWFRFRQAADRTRCSLLVLGKAAYAQSSAALAVECVPMRALIAGNAVLRGFTYELRRGRQRFTPGTMNGRKPPASAWSATSPWEAEKRA
jgi:hypothetical protein